LARIEASVGGGHSSVTSTTRRNAWHRLDLFALNLAFGRDAFRVVFVKPFLGRFCGSEDLQLFTQTSGTVPSQVITQSFEKWMPQLPFRSRRLHVISA